MKTRSASLAGLLLACGGEAAPEGKVSLAFPLTQAQCPTLDATQPLRAKLLISDVEPSRPPIAECELSVALEGESYTAKGKCPNVPLGVTRVLTLRWFVASPLLGKEIVLAEVAASAPLESVKTPTVEIAFDANRDPKLKPTTKAAASASNVEKDRFNCDRGGNFGPGSTPCDSMMPMATGAERDNCSNLEELCKGTLFNASDDTDCP